MHQEQIEFAKQLISKTSILSSLEKAEWLQLLPNMNDKQIFELTKILSPGQPPFPSAPRPAAPRPMMPKVDITQKEIATTVPFYEKEITAPTAPQPAAPVKPVMPPAAKSAQPQPLSPQALREQAMRYQQSMPPTPPPAAPEPPKVWPKAEPLHLSFHAPEDFAGLSPELLHGRDPYAVLQDVLNAVADMAKNRKSLSIIYNVEQSPLYKAYVSYGTAMLNQSAGGSALSKDEFEAFTDFRKELDKLVM